MIAKTIEPKKSTEQIESVLPRIRILHERAYTFDGHEGQVRPQMPSGSQGILPSEGYPELVTLIAQQIYGRCYTGHLTSLGQAIFTDDRLMKHKFLQAVNAANGSRFSLSPGWRVVAREDTVYRLESAQRGALVAEHDAVEGPDDEGFARLRTGRSSLGQAAWYHAYGEDGIPADGTPITRVYWHVSVEGAVPLMKTLTTTFNDERIPFQFKLLREPQHYVRRDAAVLYMPTYAWARSKKALTSIHRAVAGYLREGTPMFTLELATGLGLAEDPGNTESYGLNRCRHISEGLWDAHVAGATSASARYDAVVARFRASGIDPERIWLRPGSNTDYKLEGAARAPIPLLRRE